MGSTHSKGSACSYGPEAASATTPCNVARGTSTLAATVVTALASPSTAYTSESLSMSTATPVLVHVMDHKLPEGAILAPTTTPSRCPSGSSYLSNGGLETYPCVPSTTFTTLVTAELYQVVYEKGSATTQFSDVQLSRVTTLATYVARSAPAQGDADTMAAGIAVGQDSKKTSPKHLTTSTVYETKTSTVSTEAVWANSTSTHVPHAIPLSSESGLPSTGYIKDVPLTTSTSEATRTVETVENGHLTTSTILSTIVTTIVKPEVETTVEPDCLAADGEYVEQAKLHQVFVFFEAPYCAAS